MIHKNKMQFHFILRKEVYVFTNTCPDGALPLASFQENEAMSYVINQSLVKEKNISFIFPCRCIQLKEETALTAVGITAKVSGILADRNIPCNVIAAYYHDYFFVPEERVEEALILLNSADFSS